MEHKQYYKNSIIIFAIVIPLLLVALLIGVLLFFKSKTDKKLIAQKAAYAQEQKIKKQLKVLKEDVGKQEKMLLAWEKLNENEALVNVSNQFNRLSKLKQFDLLSLDEVGNGLSVNGESFDATVLSCKFQGSMKSIQEGLFRFESALPSAHLMQFTLSEEQGNVVLAETQYVIIKK